MKSASSAIQSRVRRFYLFEALVAFQIWSPFWTLWLFAHSDYFHATLIDVVFWVVSLLVAMPAGAIADRYGRTKALLLGVALWILGIVTFGVATTFEAFALANGVWAFGAGFLWGTGSAYLYDTLLEVRLEERYPLASSRVALFSFLGTALASALGGLIVASTGRFDLTLLLYAVPGGAALGIAATFREPDVVRQPQANLAAQIRVGLRTAARNRTIILVIIFQVLIGVVTYVMGFFRPRFIDDIVHGDYVLMGLVYSGFFCVAGLAGLQVSRLLERLGESGVLLLTALLVFPPFALVYAIRTGIFASSVALALGIATQAAFYIVWGIEGPTITTILNRRVASSDRATVLAIASFFGTLVIAFVEPVVGFLATQYDIGMGLAALAAAAVLPTGYVLVEFRRLERVPAPVGGPAASPRGR